MTARHIGSVVTILTAKEPRNDPLSQPQSCGASLPLDVFGRSAADPALRAGQGAERDIRGSAAAASVGRPARAGHVARLLGVSKDTYRNWEANRRLPSARSRPRVARPPRITRTSRASSTPTAIRWMCKRHWTSWSARFVSPWTRSPSGSPAGSRKHHRRVI